MGFDYDSLKRFARFAGEVAAETLWPTRCALCDVPGEVLCDTCAKKLPFLDWWRACPRCGAPFGKVQCDLCNSVSLARIGRTELPFSGCASATVFTYETGQLVRIYKDHGEQRLAGVLAAYMARAIAPDWRFGQVAFVPATRAAFKSRGFDHAELLAREVSRLVKVPVACPLMRPATRDQRALGASERVTNLGAGFRTRPDASPGEGVLLVDDVFTTGATLCAATDALTSAGASRVYCLTFARV